MRSSQNQSLFRNNTSKTAQLRYCAKDFLNDDEKQELFDYLKIINKTKNVEEFMKLELTKLYFEDRKVSIKDKANIKNGLLKFSNINGVNVYDIETIAQMKRQAFLSRNKIRDFYDIGFLLDKYPQCFDLQNLTDIENKIHYMGADELNLMNEVETHKLKIENDNESVCNYAEKILEKINEIYKESKFDNSHSTQNQTPTTPKSKPRTPSR